MKTQYGAWVPFIAACGGIVSLAAPAQAQENSVSTRQGVRGYEARLSTDRTQYRAGRAVEITFTLSNLLNQNVSTVTPPRGLYDYSVRDGRTNRVVYTLSRHKAAPGRTTVGLSAQESRSFRELWDGRDDAGNRVGEGVYVIDASVWPMNNLSLQVFLSGNGDGPVRPPRPGDDDGGNLPGRPPFPGGGRPGDGGEGNGFSTLSGSTRADRSTARPGDAVALSYSVRNTSSRPIAITFRSGQQFDAVASGPNGSVIWQDSANKRYAQMLRTITLAAGQQMAYNTTWQVPANAAPGTYTVSLYLTPGGPNPRAATATTTIRVGNTASDNNFPRRSID